jgi:arginine-tRNA-protein transferase
VRIVVDEFKPKRTFSRINKQNSYLIAERVPAKATAEQYRLFSAYQEARHAGGDMALMGFYGYRSMVEDSPINTFLVEFRRPDGVLEAACLTDLMSDGLSAVYSFFRVAPANSLGTYMILWLVQEARRVGLPYVYLGYWIAESEKMAYKARFGPLEAFGPGGWRRLET